MKWTRGQIDYTVPISVLTLQLVNTNTTTQAVTTPKRMDRLSDVIAVNVARLLGVTGTLCAPTLRHAREARDEYDARAFIDW